MPTLQWKTAAYVVMGLFICCAREQPALHSHDATAQKAQPARLAEGEAVPAQQAPFSGVLLAERSVELSADTAGQVSQLRAQLGQVVAAGEVLVVLDAQALQKERDEVSAEVDSAGAQHKVAAQEEESARALSQRRERAVHDEPKAVSEEELELTEFAHKRAQARLLQFGALVKQKQATLARLDLRMVRMQLRAPWPGVVAATYVAEGTMAAPGQPLLRLLSSGPALLRFVVPSVRRVQPGQRMCLLLPDEPTQALAARVTHVAPELDEAIGAVVAEARLTVPLPPQLHLGMSVQVTTDCESARAAAFLRDAR